MNRRNHNTLSKLAAFLTFFIFLNAGLYSQDNSRDFEISKNLEIFSDLYKELELNYVDEISPGELIKTGIDAMLESLDPFTNFIPESQIEDYRLLTTGQYGGIGSLIHQQGEYVVISDPYENFPAHKAGLLPGDKILEVDGKSAIGKTTDEVSAVLKGEPGSMLKLLVEREGEDTPFEIELKRENIKIDNIPYYGMLNENIGYIKLSGFTQNAGKEVKRAFLELKQANEMSGIVLDLRGNGGGLLNEAVNIVNIFTPKGELVVSTKGKDSSRNRSYQTSDKPEDTEIPIVVLVDQSSASASEIVSGALQDLDRGVVVGQKTYGKGLVQNVVPLSYKSQVKITVAKYYIPSGRCIQAIDYSHKDIEGNAHKIPDSLMSVFTTKNGRKVFDAGGIMPDVAIEPEKLSPISIALLTKYVIFDFANQFARENDSIPRPDEFVITDDIYADFVDYVNNDENFDYTTSSERMLSSLREAAKDEDYYQEISDEIKHLELKLMHNKDEDLQTHKNEISEMLQVEIVSRYFYQRGRIITSLRTDSEVKKAIEIIENKNHYTSILDGTTSKASMK
jgi:carboxyl-terminal processing protease